MRGAKGLLVQNSVKQNAVRVNGGGLLGIEFQGRRVDEPGG